jgi:hypothetical protein
MANVQISDLPFAITPLIGATTFFEVEATEGGVVVSRRVAADDLVVSATTLFINGTSTDDPSIGGGVFDGQLLWRNVNLQQTGVFGFDPAGDNFIWSNDAEGGFHQIAIRDGTVLVETIAAAAGGLLANNLLTGAGLERVLTASDFFAGPVGTSVDDPTAPGSFNAQLQWQNALADPLANLGFNADAVFAIDSVIHGGVVRIRGEDLLGVLNTLFEGDPGNGVLLFWDGALRFFTSFTGINVQGDGVGNPATGAAQDVDLTLSNSLGAFAAQLGFPTSTTDLRLKNFVHGGTVELIGEDAGGVERNIFVADPDGIAQIFNVGVATLRTTTAAAGGAEANNTLTGAGFERVLTASDAFTGIITGSSTDSPETPGGTWDGLLRFENANNLQTARVGFEPAGDTFFVQPTVEGGRLILGGRSPGAPGVLREAIVIDFDTGALPAGSTRFFEANGTAEKMRLDTGVDAVTEVANVGNNPASGLAQHGQFRVTNNSAQVAGEFGFPATGGLSTTMRVKNFVHGGPVELVGENAAGTERILFFYDPDNSGPIIFGPLDNNPATDASIQDTRLTFRNPSAQTIWQIGFLEGTNDFSLKLFQDTGTLRLRGSSAASGDILLAIFDPVADAKLFQAGAEVFRTLAAASGGAQANNTLTGAGFERVLTTGDLTSVATSGVSPFDIASGAAADPTLTLTENVTLSTTFLHDVSTDITLIRNEVNSGHLELRARSSAGVDRRLLTGDPDNQTILYWQDNLRVRTAQFGTEFIGSSATGSTLRFFGSNGTTLVGLMTIGGGGVNEIQLIPNATNDGQAFRFLLSDAGGVAREMLRMDPDNSVDLSFAGVVTAETVAEGFGARSAAADPVFQLIENISLRGTWRHVIATGVSELRNREISGHVQIRATDLLSADVPLITGDPDGPVELYHDALLRAYTNSVGLTLRGDGADSGNFTMEDTGVATIFHIDVTAGITQIRSFINANVINIVGDDTGAVTRNLITMDPDGANSIELYEVGVSVARTATAALGGLFANNTLTGAGFERVLTTADRRSAEIYTPTNVSTDRAYDANATTLDELADVLGTLIADLQAIDVIQ